jgi:hypothetical protein
MRILRSAVAEKPHLMRAGRPVLAVCGELHCHRRARSFVRWRFWARLIGKRGSRSPIITHETPMTDDQSEEELFIALGGAASKLWSSLPQEMQHMLFDEAVSFRGEAIRQPLAIFLHGRHSRTTDALKAEAVLEPDSPGG